MIQALAALPAVLRHLRAGLVAIALITAMVSHHQKLRAERALERCRGEAALAQERLERALAAARTLQRDSERRTAEQKRLVGEAERSNASERATIERLQRSTDAPRANDDCRLSEALKQAEVGL